jgi:molybdopterin converting factor small subunit
MVSNIRQISMKITLLFFGPAKVLVGKESIEFESSKPTSINEIMEVMFQQYPKLANLKSCLRYAVDYEYVVPSTRLTKETTLALIPPVQGG